MSIRREELVSMAHAVVVPFPTPGHINPLLRLSQLLHAHGSHITFVITDDVHGSLVQAGNAPPLEPCDRFRITVVSVDGFPAHGRQEGMDYLKDLTIAAGTTLVDALRELAAGMEAECRFPRVTCVVTGLLAPALKVAEEMGVPGYLFWTTGACGFMGTLHMQDFVDRGYVPLKDEGAAEAIINWIPGMMPLRPAEISSLLKTADPDDVYIRFHLEAAAWASRADGVILNTAEELEEEILDAIRPRFKKLYTVGPISALCDGVVSAEAAPVGALRLSLWSEDRDCLPWLDRQSPRSVLYVNFGSIAVVDAGLLREIALGVASSGHPFLWIIRPTLVAGLETDGLSELKESTMKEARSRGFITSWCPQEEVLAHPAIGAFLTHAGWNSMLESLRQGVPMLCWPMHVDQFVNSRYACKVWNVAIEIREGQVRRKEVEALVREVMVGAKAVSLQEKARTWKAKLRQTICKQQGNNYQNFQQFLKSIISSGVN